MLHKHLMQTIAVMLAAGSATAYGQDLPAPSFRMEPARTAPLELRTPVQQGETTARGATATDRGTQAAFTLEAPEMSVGRGPLKAIDRPKSTPKPRGAVSGVTDLQGQWINQYPFLLTSLTGGSTAVITPLEGSTTAVTISNFWRSGGIVKAILNTENSTLTIQSQTVIKRTDGTSISVAPVNMANGKPIRTQALVLTINADGSMTSDVPWGIFYDRDDPNGGDEPAYEKDDYANVYSSISFERGTSIMSHINKTRGDTTSYPVIATQTGANVLEVKNFLGYGQTVKLLMNRNHTYTCRSQVGLVEGNTAYYTRGDLVLNDKGAPESWSETFSFAEGGDPKVVQFGNMSLFYGKSYWVGLISSATLNLAKAPDFPAPLNPLEGEGTQASPYLIKNYNDLCQVQETVNSDNNFNYTLTTETDTIHYSRPYLGKYLKLMADIDMTGYDFTPIGNGTHYFAGHFDGNGHTVKGLDVYAGEGYAAMFGVVDKEGSLSNLTLDDIYVQSKYVYAAALASRCEGPVTNCHVKNSTILLANGTQGAGGMTGTSYGISNSTVTNTTVQAADGYGGGLTAQAFGPIVNCHVTNTTVAGVMYNANTIPPFGGITATSTNAITDCSFAGTITIPNEYYPVCMGGLVGIIQGLSNGTGITRSVASGNFLATPGNYSSYNRVGGLAGICAANITDSYSSGWVRARNSLTSGTITGLVQYLSNDNGTVQPVFNRVYSSAWLDCGTVNYNPQPSSCMELFGSSDAANPPTIFHSYFNSDITDLGSTEHRMTTAQLTAASGPAGFSTSYAWTMQANTYPRLKAMINLPVSDISGSAVLYVSPATRTVLQRNLQLNAIDDTEFGFLVNGKFTTKGHYASIEGGTLKLNSDLQFGNDTLAVRNGALMQQYVALMAPIPWQGDGTAASPWLITNKADMLALGKMTSESRVSFPGTYYKMTADINMEYDETFNGISSTNTTGRTQFHGTFDGDGHTISKLKIGRLVWTVKPEDDPKGIGTVNTTLSRATYIGLIGDLAKDGVVKNVNIAADCKYEAFASVGSIVGYNYGLIENCRNYADVFGFSSWIGGITGQSAKGGVIRNCFNAGEVSTGYRNVGGITGQTQGILENCANTGSVYALSRYQAAGKDQIRYAGGIAGGMNGARVVNCYNSGSVYALEGYAGGITGTSPKTSTSANYPNDIIGNVNTGVVDCGVQKYVGGISGGTGTEGTVENNYYDGMLAPSGAIESAPMTGMTGLTTQQFTAGTPLSGLEASLWNMAADSYPAPTAYAAEPSVAAARHQYILFGENENRSAVTGPATLSAAQGLSWSVLSSNGFTISGNTLQIPANDKATALDTVQASLNGYKRLIPVQFVPKAPWSGSGTAADPYLIPTPELWNAIGTRQEQTGTNYEGKVFRLTADLDFGQQPINIIAADPASFNGIIDGNGHSLNNYVLDITSTYRAPIGVLAASGEIRNLTVNGTQTVTMTSGNAYTGGIVAKCYGKITNCVNKSTITSKRGYVGGIAGYAYTGSVFTECVNRGKLETTASAGYIAGIVAFGQEGVSYIKCGNEGTLTTTGTTGYIAGICAESSESRFEECYNKADINLEKVLYLGGIVGRMSGSKNATQIYNFIKCSNSGNIRGKAQIGGISTYASSTVGAAMGQYTNCVNTGNLEAVSNTSSSSSPAAAGIAAQYKPGSYYLNCSNSGTISVTDKAYGAGGILGTTSGVATQDYTITVENCLNTGEIKGLGSSCYWAGGIIGHANDFVLINNCTNTAPVSAQYGAGGIAGALWGKNARIDDSRNTGDITVDRRMAGGIVGTQGVVNAKTASAVISGCWNSGTVKSLSTTIGVATTSAATDGHAIGGIAGQFPGLIENCANFGAVSGPTMVAGILGEPVMNKSSQRSQVKDCYNAAPVECMEGGVMAGITITSQPAFWNDLNALSNCYYATDWGNKGEVSPGTTGVTLAQLCNTNISEGWTLLGKNIMPVPAAMRQDNGWKCNAAAVILRSDNSFDNVRRNFNVGIPEGVTWTIDPATAPLEQQGDLMKWTTENYSGAVTLTARCGDFTRSWKLEAKQATGIGYLDETVQDIRTELWFTPDGLQVPAPKSADGKIYIKVTIYDDGTQTTRRITNR